MPRYRKTPKNRSFDGVTSIRHDSGYLYQKIVFAIVRDSIVAAFFHGQKKMGEIVIEEFRLKSALEVISEHPETGRHFEDGIHEIYHFFKLSLGYVQPLLRTQNAHTL